MTTATTATHVLRISHAARAPGPDEVVLVTDTTWTPRAGEAQSGRVISLRDVAERVMRERDVIAETAGLLDDWAESTGIAELLAVDGTSFWYGMRLRHWTWLLDQLLWITILDDVLAGAGPRAIAIEHGVDEGLVEAGRLVAARDGLRFEPPPPVAVAASAPAGPPAADAAAADDLDADPPDHQPADPPAAARVSAHADAPRAPVARVGAPRRKGQGKGRRRGGARGIVRRIRRRISGARQESQRLPRAPEPPREPILQRLNQSLRDRFFPPEPERRRRLALKRLDRIANSRVRPLLVVQAHVRQRVDTPAGSRLVNTYLGPVLDRLRGSDLDPVELDIRGFLEDDETWERLREQGGERMLPADVLTIAQEDPVVPGLKERAAALSNRLATLDAPLVVSGIDLGPALARRVAQRSRAALVRAIVDVERIRRLIRRIRPAGILLADEYHRQDWLAAAARERIPTAAIQHGVIYRWHTGYIHRTRPASLRLPNRTYVFGEWERDLLVTHSVYRPDEVVVGGSPRLDLHDPGPVDREAVRAEIGVDPEDRMVVLSGTWGPMYRRFHYPIALARLFDRSVERVHLVVKLHPSERDEGPYREAIERLAAARGFAPPRISVVQRVDLYRLLAAADAHLGIHSTVLTEAVVTGTRNLLADVLAASDLLGYVDAGAAHPVRCADDLEAALARPREALTSGSAREAFLRAHFEPGEASRRIADDLLAWLR